MKDPRGLVLDTASPTAVAAQQQALWRMMSFFDVPMADLDAATDADPGWALPHLMKCGFLLSITEPSLLGAAREALQTGESLLRSSSTTEHAHAHALRQLLDGHWHEACASWNTLLIDHPRDALALQWAQLWDFYRGDAPQLRLRAARALPEWDDTDPLYPYVLGHHAFGLEECNLYPQAEETGRRALAGGAQVPWAVHAVAHVMEMQGRYDEGAAWLRLHQDGWAEGNGLSGHLWWHLGLFRLESLDVAGALRLLDKYLTGDALKVTLQRLDAAALLWRVHLLDGDVQTGSMQARFQALAANWQLDHIDFKSPEAGAGHYAFNDVHALLALIGAGELHRAESWLGAVAAAALRSDDMRRSNHAMTRHVGAPLMRGLLAYAQGRYDAAADTLYPVRAVAQQFGGSHAQRDLIDQTLLSACARGNRKSLGRALINERLMAKPATPLTRHWAWALGVTLSGGAPVQETQ